MDLKEQRERAYRVGGRNGEPVTFEGIPFFVKIPGVTQENEYNRMLGIDTVDLEPEDPKKTLGGPGKVPEGKRIPDSAKNLTAKTTIKVKIDAMREARIYLVSVCTFDETGEYLFFEDKSMDDLLEYPDHEGSMIRVLHDTIQKLKDETEKKAKNSQAIRNSSTSAGSQNGEDASRPKLESLEQTTSMPG